MTDYKENMKVVHANELVQQAHWQVKEVPLKLFKILVACIDTNHPPKDNTVTITKSELLKTLKSKNDTVSTNYTYLKKRLRELQATSIGLGDKDETYVSLVSNIKWLPESDVITCRFDNDLMPYLVDLKERFIQYEVDLLPRFTKYGLILFEYLTSYEDQYKTGQVTLTIDQFRALMGIDQKKYKVFKDLEKYVIKTAVENMNSAGGAKYLCRYEKIKTGAKVTAVTFYARQRTSWKGTKYEEVLKPSVLTHEADPEIIDAEPVEGQISLFDNESMPF